MASIDDILAAAADPSHGREAVARILLRQDLRARHAELDAELSKEMAEYDADITKPEHVHDLAARVAAVEDEMAAAEIVFRFRAMRYVDWMQLIAAHPPTKQQRTENQYLDHNPDTFQPEALAASCVDPVMSVEQAVAMRDALPFDLYTVLWGTCASVSRGGDALPKSRVAGLILRRNGTSGTIAAPEESLAASSLDAS